MITKIQHREVINEFDLLCNVRRLTCGKQSDLGWSDYMHLSLQEM